MLGDYEAVVPDVFFDLLQLPFLVYVFLLGLDQLFPSQDHKQVIAQLLFVLHPVKVDQQSMLVRLPCFRADLSQASRKVALS